MLDRVPGIAFRIVGAAWFLGATGWVVSRYGIYQGPLGKAVFALEALAYLLLALAYVRRGEALERARGFLEVVPPFVGAVLPFSLSLAPYAPPKGFEVALVAALGTGDLLVVLGYAWLGPSFAITVEAREARTRGPYRVIRHPVYLGQIVTFAAVTLQRPCWWSWSIYAAFVSIQVLRAVLEERKLARVAKGYAEYRERTWMFVPFLW